MSFGMLRVKFLLIAVVAVFATTQTVGAQYGCGYGAGGGYGSAYGSGYGGGMGYMPQPSYRPMVGLGYQAGMYQAPAHVGVPIGYGSQMGAPVQSFYSNHVNYGSPHPQPQHHHHHHAWHPGHYLLGHH
ncbi:MAG: hypothetical protein ABL921_06475 [Pirellula sp.]